MTKTKEEIELLEATKEFAASNKIPYIEKTEGLILNAYRHGFKEGFEEFRVKAEEGVKKQASVLLNQKYGYLVNKEEVLTTIKNIKQ
jgi:flagellar biosynthesis/type III secretory pathway protein FliH